MGESATLHCQHALGHGAQMHRCCLHKQRPNIVAANRFVYVVSIKCTIT